MSRVCGRPFSSLIRAGCLALGLAAAAVGLGGCAEEAGAPEQRVRRDPNVVLTYAACGLGPAVEAARARFEAENPGKSVEIEVGEPRELVERIREGAVPDLVVLVGDAELARLEREGFLDRTARQQLARYRLAIVAPAGNPADVESAQDLLSARVRAITIAIPGLTSSGTHAKAALERLGVWSGIQAKLTLRETPLEALRAVAAGDAEAAVVYDPCPALWVGAGVAPEAVAVAVVLPTDQRGVAVHVGVHRRSPSALLAQRFMRTLASEQIAAEFTRRPGKPTDEEPAAGE